MSKTVSKNWNQQPLGDDGLLKELENEKHKKLESVFLYGCKLTKIPQQLCMTTLKILVLRHNDITDIAPVAACLVTLFHM